MSIDYLSDTQNNRLLEKEFYNNLVATADLNLSGTCPLIEDEATVWAGEVIKDYRKLEKTIKELKSIARDCCDTEMMLELDDRLESI